MRREGYIIHVVCCDSFHPPKEVTFGSWVAMTTARSCTRPELPVSVRPCPSHCPQGAGFTVTSAQGGQRRAGEDGTPLTRQLTPRGSHVSSVHGNSIHGNSIGDGIYGVSVNGNSIHGDGVGGNGVRGDRRGGAG